MKRATLLFAFITLCLFLLLFTRKAYTQQGILDVDLYKILHQSYLFTFPSYFTPPAFYPPIQFSPWQFSTTFFPTIPNMLNYSFFFGNDWNLWQLNSINNLTYPFPFTKKESRSSKENQSVLSDQETTLDSTVKFSATTDRSSYDKAELIEISLIFENDGSDEVIIEFPSEQKFDIMVKENSGEIVRQLSSDIQDSQPSNTLTLLPDGTKTFYFKWNQEDDDGMIVPSGTYTIDVSLSATNPEYQKNVSVTISIRDLPRFPNCKRLKETLKEFWDEIKPPEPTNGDGTSESNGSTYPRVGILGPGYGGLYGGAWAYQISALPGYGFGGGPAISYTTGLFGGYAGTRGYGSSTYGITGLFGGYAGAGGYGSSLYSSSLYGGFGGYGPAVYGGLSGNYGGVSGYVGFTGYGTTGLSGNYGGYAGIPGSFRLKTTSDLQVRDKENTDHGYSITNVQVVGVDEAAIIKNDGTYIYMIKGNTVHIIQGLPADSMQIVNVISPKDNINFKLKRIYVQGNTLILIGEIPVPVDSYHSTSLYGTKIYVYDITDRRNEILTRKFIFWGAYLQSRKAADTLYVIMNEPAPLKRFEGTLTDLRVLLPHFYDSYINGSNEDNDAILCDCDEVAYLPEHLSPNYLVVVGIPLDDHTKAIGREVILGKSDKVYATTENLYVTSEYDNNHPTDIYKFWLDGETIAYGSNAQVSGRIINQFSMDEYEDHLRIATTSGSGSQAENNIYIFDSGMKKSGALEDFTSGGSIKSIRFIDDRCYTVISREILPLNIISLSDPTNPVGLEVLGIFSGTYYLHPIDENRLLGFGREMVGSTEMGMKISFYDITDLSSPQLISEDEIGTLYTKSEVLSDHTALSLSLEKNLMAFPVTVTEENEGLIYLFQGAYVYYIDDNGFEKIEEGVSHHPEWTFPIPIGSYDDTSPYHINRIIYMGDYYYSVSNSRITARDILTHTETFSLSLE